MNQSLTLIVLLGVMVLAVAFGANADLTKVRSRLDALEARMLTEEMNKLAKGKILHDDGNVTVSAAQTPAPTGPVWVPSNDYLLKSDSPRPVFATYSEGDTEIKAPQTAMLCIYDAGKDAMRCAPIADWVRWADRLDAK